MGELRVRRIVLLVMAVCLGGLPDTARAQSNEWEVVLAPYVLFGSLTGDAAVGPTGPTPVDLGFGDIVKNLEFGVMGHAEVWKGAWGFVGDVIYLDLGSDLAIPVLGVLDIGVQEVVAEGLLGRRFRAPRRQIDVLAGVRYWNLGLDLELVSLPGAGLNLGDDWVDPVVGSRILQEVGEEWSLIARGDVGGFGLGSDFSWNVQGGVGYDVSDTFSLVAQYRALSVDFENDDAGSADFLSYDTVTHGPLLGFVFRF